MGGPAEAKAKLQLSPAELKETVQNYDKEKKKRPLFSRYRADSEGVFTLKALAECSDTDETNATALLAPLLKAEQSHLVKHTLMLIVRKMFARNIVPDQELKQREYNRIINILSSLYKESLLENSFIQLLPELMQPILNNEDECHEIRPFLASLDSTLSSLSNHGLLTRDNLQKIIELNGIKRQYFIRMLMYHVISATHHKDIRPEQQTRTPTQFDVKAQIESFIDEVSTILNNCPEEALPLFLQKTSTDDLARATGRLFSWDTFTTVPTAYYKMYCLLNTDEALTKNDNKLLNELLENKKLFWHLSRAWPHCFHFFKSTQEHFWKLFSLLKPFYNEWARNSKTNIPQKINTAIILYQSDISDEKIANILENKTHDNRFISVLSEANLLTEDNLNKAENPQNPLQSFRFQEKSFELLWDKVPSSIPYAALDQAFLDKFFAYNPDDHNNKTKPFKRLVSMQLKQHRQAQSLLKKDNKQIYKKHSLNKSQHSAEYTRTKYPWAGNSIAWGGTPLIRLYQGLKLTVATTIFTVLSFPDSIRQLTEKTGSPLIGFFFGLISAIFSTPSFVYKKLKDTLRDSSEELPSPIRHNNEAFHKYHSLNTIAPFNEYQLDLPANDAHVKLYLQQQIQKQKRHFPSIVPKFLHRYLSFPIKKKPDTDAIDSRFYGTKLEIKSSYRKLLDDFSSTDQDTKQLAVERLKAIVDRKTTAKTDKFEILSSKLSEEMSVSTTAANDRSEKMTTLETGYSKLDKPRRKALSALFQETKRQHLKLETLSSLAKSLKRPGLAK